LTTTKQPALFLDRDGVINVEKHYLYKIEEVVFVEGIFELCRHYESLGYLIIVVTNQSGIARGKYSEDDFKRVSEWMRERFKEEGVHISAIYHCPHHPDFSGECSCRKPKPGMFLEAKERFDLDMAHSIMIGDSERDIEAAQRAGVGYTVLLSDKTECSTHANQSVQELRCLF
jgi:D-glycero-D-manno-heptose 1,7-bisphosphate phosphatase